MLTPISKVEFLFLMNTSLSAFTMPTAYQTLDSLPAVLLRADLSFLPLCCSFPCVADWRLLDTHTHTHAHKHKHTLLASIVWMPG